MAGMISNVIGKSLVALPRIGSYALGLTAARLSLSGQLRIAETFGGQNTTIVFGKALPEWRSGWEAKCGGVAILVARSQAATDPASFAD